jgi:hypothetical protein
MEKETLGIANGIVHNIERLETEIQSIVNYNGNKWYLGFGQDNATAKGISTDDKLFDDVLKYILKRLRKELKELKDELEKL